QMDNNKFPQIFDELLSSGNVMNYMAFAYNLPIGTFPDDPSWIWQQLWGNPWLAMAVYTDMEEKDSMIASVLETRKDNLLSRPRRVIPASQKRQDIKVANFIEETLEGYFDQGDGMRVGLDHTLFEAQDAVGKGLSIGEIIYANAPDRVFIKRVEFKPQHLFAFGGDGLAAYSTGSNLYPQNGPLRLRPGIFLDGVSDEAPLPNYKFFVHSYRPRYSNRWGSPTDRKAFWASWFKRASIKQWLRFLEKGPGSVVTRYNDGAPVSEQERALDAARAVNEEAAVALAQKFPVEVLQHVRQSMGSAYREMVDDFCNNEIARIYLGQTLTSRGSEGGGSRALGEVHERVGDKKTEVDAKSLMMPVNMQLVWPLVLLNFGPNVRPPMWMIDYEPGRDLQATQKWLEGLHRMRVPISKKFVFDVFPMNEPESEEDTLPPPSGNEESPRDDADEGENETSGFAEGGQKKKRPDIHRQVEQAAQLEDGAIQQAAPLYDEIFARVIAGLGRAGSLNNASDALFDKLAGLFDELTRTLAGGLLASNLLAHTHISGRPPAAEFDEADEGPLRARFDMPPEEAVDYFRRKRVVPRKQFDKLDAEARSAAFTVSGLYQTDLLEAFKEEIAQALENGETQQQVVKGFREILEGAGHRELGDFHLETIFRTNMQVAYGVGRRRALEDIAEDLPFWEYSAVLDDRTRPAHRALDGLVLPANHEFWNEHFPPHGFNCRCVVNAVADIPDSYNPRNPSGEAEIAYDRRGNPAKAEYGTAVYDLGVGKFKGIPPQGNLQSVIEAGIERAKRGRYKTPEAVLTAEDKIRFDKTETVMFFGPEGDLLFRETGKADQVEFELTDEQVE
ncbi:MAG: phage portal protein family protein, partial [Pyrinomonadaceae bacterium]